MAIEGDRHSAGFFSPGDSLSASHLNDLAGHSSRGQQIYSSGPLLAQGTFGTVDLSPSPMPPAAMALDQFDVTVEEEKTEETTTYWFSVKPGYVTILDYIIRMTALPNGNVVAGDTSIQAGETAATRLYYVERCNAFGAKRDLDKDNKLVNNQFKADANEGDKVVVFIYRSSPDAGSPKIGVMKESTFFSYFTNGANFSPSVTQPNYGSPAGYRLTLEYLERKYWSGEKEIGSHPTGLSDMTMAADKFLSTNYWLDWSKVGLNVQVIAHFDTTTKILTQVKRGHAWMAAPAELTRVEVLPLGGHNNAIIYENNGFGAYYYANPDADFTGLKFE